MNQQGQYKNEFLREATGQHAKESEWRELLNTGNQRAREQGLSLEDVGRLVEEYRAETEPSPPHND